MNNRIMIVDDELDILTSLKTILEHEKYDVVTVDSGAKCLEEIERGFQGVVLMDLMMPGLDGWDTIKAIVDKGLIKQVAVEIITGKGTKNHERMGILGSYIYDYLSKPLDIGKLISSVDKCNKYLTAKNT